MDTVDRAVAAFAAEHHGVFGARDLRQLGVSEPDRKYRIRVGRWVVVHDGVYRVAGAPQSWRGDLLAACLAGGARAAASHRSAAALHLLPGQRDDTVEVTCPRWRRGQHQGLLVHESRALGDRDVTIVDGIPVTTVERTIFDLCAVVGRTTVDYAIDNAIRRELTTVGELLAVLRRVGRRGRKGTRLLRGLLAERDARYTPTESEREQMLLRIIRRSGLPDPVCQYSVHDQHGQFVARVDLAYPDLHIAIEYDSYQEHIGKQQLVRDARRRNAMAALGWLVIAGTAEDVRLGSGTALISAIRRARQARVATLGATGVKSDE